MSARAVEVFAVASGEVIDVIRRSDDGPLHYDTADAHDVVNGLASTRGISPAQVFDLLADGWSNGYVASRTVAPDVVTLDVGRRRLSQRMDMDYAAPVTSEPDDPDAPVPTWDPDTAPQ